MSQLIRVGHSPDPDDAFMFHALANRKIDTGDLVFTHELQDIESLNRRAFNASRPRKDRILRGNGLVPRLLAITAVLLEDGRQDEAFLSLSQRFHRRGVLFEVDCGG